MTHHDVAADHSKVIAQIIGECLDLEGPLLPILHLVQEECGYISDDAKQQIAKALNLSRAEVHGVVTFYPDFRDRLAGRHVLKLCRAEACQSMGCDRIADDFRRRLGIDWHQTTADGQVTLEPVFCLGLCAQAPAAQLNDELYARIDTHCLNDIVEELRK